ncbi:MAG: phosphoribosyltransferase family protein [Elusimicrobiota bacterium]|nr:phosphoribosyltransferase family protein [Elusimicrobiota bacterium]
METWSRTLLRWLLPAACPFCREDLAPGEDGPLCPACLDGLPAPPDAQPPSTGKACRFVRAAARHAGPAAALVHALKFRGARDGARQAGRAMARELARRPELWGCDALVPVPAHPSRERRRGYDQALLIARELGVVARLPVLRLLERRRAGAPAWTLGRVARREQVRGAFGPAPWATGLAAGRRLLLIDDVCATGETLEDCARALRRAGARDAAGLVFARAGD